jgi:hypothetical protein
MVAICCEAVNGDDHLARTERVPRSDQQKPEVSQARPSTYSGNTFCAYRVWMLYPWLCLVSPEITEKSFPAIDKIVPPFDSYGSNRLSRVIASGFVMQRVSSIPQLAATH